MQTHAVTTLALLYNRDRYPSVIVDVLNLTKYRLIDVHGPGALDLVKESSDRV